MKIELRCDQCRQCFLMEADPGEIQMVCPACSAPMQVQVVAPAAVDVESTQPVAAQPVAQPVVAQPVVAQPVVAQPVVAQPVVAQPAAAQAVASPPPGPQQAVATYPAAASKEEVVCPRCNLHFRPRPESRGERAERADTPLVLVVEDMGYFREIAQDALEGSYRVKTATNCAEARQRVAEGGVDLMILDLTLDGGDHGIDLLRGFASKPCPILIYTAQDESEMYGDRWDELQALGADDIVMKGMNVGESLLRKVASLLGLDEDEISEGPQTR